MTLEGIKLAVPAWLLLYPILIGITIWWKRNSGNQSEVSNSIDSPGRDIHVFHPLAALSKRPGKHGYRADRPRFIVTWLILALLVIALAQPERQGKKLPEPLPQRDIVFIVDTSVSMTLRDYVVEGQRVSRMTVVKGVLDEFVRNLRGSNISVIVFGEEAFTYVPLTSDHNFVREMFLRMHTTMAGRFNAIGDGIALAVRNAMETSGRHTVLVLLTDADRSTGSITPENGALLARNANLPLYTIAIGASTEAAEEKRTTGLIYQRVNLDLLDSMAQQTGAKSYRAGAAFELRDAIADIEKNEKREVSQPARFYKQSLYQWFLIPALILTGLYPLISIMVRCRK